MKSLSGAVVILTMAAVVHPLARAAEPPPPEAAAPTTPETPHALAADAPAHAPAPPVSEVKPATDPATPEPTAEELEALKKALGADQAATPSAPASGAQGGAGNWSFNYSSAQNQAAQMLQSMNPEMALIADVAGAWFSSDDNLQLGGHDPKKTGFTLQQLEMSLGASVDPFFRLDSNIVFAQFGVEVEEAYATTLALPFNLQMRFGQFLTRIGRQNNTHPHSWKFVDQPLVHGKFFGSENNRGLGLETSWLVPLPWYVELVGSATDSVGDCCARSYLGGSGLTIAGPQDVLATAALKQFFPFSNDLSLLWGLSLQGGPNASGQGNRTEIYATDVYLRYRPVNDPGRGSLNLTAEGFHRRRQVPGAVLADAGYYAQLVGQFALQYELGVRAEGVSGVADDPLDPTWTGFAQRYSLQASYYPSHFSRLRAQAGVTLPPDGRDPIWSAIVALEVLIGAHGAHTF